MLFPGKLRRLRRTREFALMLFPGKRYKIIETNWPRSLVSWPHMSRIYQLDPRKRLKLEGYWHPLDRETVFSDILARDGIKRRLTIFGEPPEINLGPIMPLDRLADSGIVKNKTDLTPQIHRTHFVSAVYKNRMRRLKIGGVDLRLVLIAFGICFGVILLLYFSGYLG